MTATWEGSPTIDELRARTDLVYRVFTVITGTSGPDGSLQSEDATVSFPLDLYTPEERPHLTTKAEVAWVKGGVHDFYEGHAIMLPTDEVSRDDVVVAVSRWCRKHLGHDNIRFEPRED